MGVEHALMKKTLIERIEVGSGGAASITFSSIPQTYTDLYLIFSARATQATTTSKVNIVLNADATNQSRRVLYGDGSSTGSGSASNLEIDINGDSSTASSFSNSLVIIPNYAGSSAKSISNDSVHENNATTALQVLNAGLWNDTSAITSLSIVASSGSIVQYSSASLYGVTAGSDGTTTVA